VFVCGGSESTLQVQLNHVEPFAILVEDLGAIQVVAVAQNVAHFVQNAAFLELHQHVFVANVVDVARVEFSARQGEQLHYDQVGMQRLAFHHGVAGPQRRNLELLEDVDVGVQEGVELLKHFADVGVARADEQTVGRLYFEIQAGLFLGNLGQELACDHAVDVFGNVQGRVGLEVVLVEALVLVEVVDLVHDQGLGVVAGVHDQLDHLHHLR